MSNTMASLSTIHALCQIIDHEAYSLIKKAKKEQEQAQIDRNKLIKTWFAMHNQLTYLRILIDELSADNVQTTELNEALQDAFRIQRDAEEIIF